MQVVKTIKQLDVVLDEFRHQGKTIGFVPTLGALHDGHMSLISKAHKEADIVVASIFVNPTQFNVKTDLDKYPRTVEADQKLLHQNNCHILFYPDEGTIYPDGTNIKPEIDLKGLDEVLEGEFRPGHFDGVVQVVKRLLDIVKPDYLLMGQKDFQQFTIIQYMIDYFGLKTKLVVCPIKREPSGLAMSSRNERLSGDAREKAKMIYKTLTYVKRRLKSHSIAETKIYAMKRMTTEDFKAEYFEIIDGRTLQPIESMEDSDYIVACAAVWVENIRLIDNKILKKAIFE